MPFGSGYCKSNVLCNALSLLFKFQECKHLTFPEGLNYQQVNGCDSNIAKLLTQSIVTEWQVARYIVPS